jgi:hypothetical protein
MVSLLGFALYLLLCNFCIRAGKRVTSSESADRHCAPARFDRREPQLGIDQVYHPAY